MRLAKKLDWKGLKVYINYLNEQKSLVNMCPRTSACLDMGDFHVTQQQMLCVVSVHFCTTFNSPCHEKCVLFKKNPKFYLNILTCFLYSLLQHHCVTAPGSEFQLIFWHRSFTFNSNKSPT
jgi:hypothetical protein